MSSSSKDLLLGAYRNLHASATKLALEMAYHVHRVMADWSQEVSHQLALHSEHYHIHFITVDECENGTEWCTHVMNFGHSHHYLPNLPKLLT